MCPRVTPVKLPARVAGGFLYYKVCSVLLKFYVTFRVCLTGRLQSPSTSKSIDFKPKNVPVFASPLHKLGDAPASGEIGRSTAGMDAEWPGVAGARNAESDERTHTGALDAECARVLASVAVDHREVGVYYGSTYHGSTMALTAMALLTMALPTVAPLTVAPPTITRLTIARSS